jgi:pimeloyl-ACP methyl ester carboxylesterase
VKGAQLAPAPWSSVTAPTLVLDGSKSPASLRAAADEFARILPDARRRTLRGQSHNVSMKALAPVLQEFLG